MLYTVKLFAILAIVGGAIAWLGDVVGARLGKKRSSLFGLRPRQTARLVAVVIGAALPLGGLLVATVASEYAHKAVFEMEQLLSSVEDLKLKVDEYREQAGQARDEAARAEEDATHSAELLIAKEDEVKNLTDQQASLTGQVTGLEGEVAAGEQAVAGAREKLDASRGALVELTDERDGLENSNEAAKGRLEQLRGEIASKIRAVDGAKVEVESRERELRALQDEFADMQRQVEDLKERDRLITGRPAVFELGDELMRVVMDADETQDQMESELFELLHFAGAVAERRGVPTGASGRAVTVVAPTPSPVEPGETVPESVIVRYVASELRTRGSEQWVVIVRTFRRLFAEDETQLQVQFKATPNVKVFAKGEVLAEIHIPDATKSGDIFKAIYRAITARDGDLRAIAISRGMLPHPVTGNYGAADLDDMFRAVEEVPAGEGVVTVRAVAARDTYTAGPLLVEVQVGEGSP